MGGKSENADTPDRSMATHVAHIQPESITIRPEDHELLRAALADWYDKTAFTDEHVMQVAFQRWLVETARTRPRRILLDAG
jgi:hypothetical protein